MKIVNALNKGRPPHEDVRLFSVGRDNLLRYFDQKLQEIKEYALSDVKFISADWGHGKTHFLDLVRQLAFEHNFVVSMVQLHSKLAPFDKLEIVVQNIMRNLATAEVRRNGLEHLLNQWADSVRGKTSSQTFHAIAALAFPDMRLKLVQYAEYRNHPAGIQYERCLQMLKWFRGEETPAKRFKDVKEYLNAFVWLIRYLGYSGLVVMLDEAEAITSLSRIQRRDLANENIRQIIDNDQDTEGFYFVFASTPTFLSGEDERGARSYEALWRRISDPFRGLTQDSLHKVIVDLPPLSEEQFFKLASSIKRIYEVAKDRALPEVEDGHLRLLAHYVQNRTDRRVGTLVRSVVSILDAVAEQEGFDFLGNYEFMVETVLRQEERARAED